MEKLTAEQKTAFETYLTELKAWNEVMNLTAIETDADIWKKHFEDSLTVLEAIPSSATSLIDIGTGAGFPGLPIKIMRPELKVVLVDTVAKKVSFLQHIIEKLDLKNITAIHARAEELGQLPDYREQFDVAVARAVAQLNILCEYTLPFVKTGGRLIAQKTKDAPELEAADQALKELGGVLKEKKDVSIQSLEPRQLIIIEKVSKTPNNYPRRSGMPSKRPL